MWYLAKIVFAIEQEKPGKTSQFDEQFRLIRADSEHEALSIAEEIGKNEEETISISDEEKITWSFSGVSELFEIGSFTNGAAVFSQTRSVKDPERFRAHVRNRNSYLEYRSLHSEINA